MSSPQSTPAEAPSPSNAENARYILRCARKGALGTIDQGSGYPYASLVATATEADGSPILLLSRLAIHTRNLEADRRASLLIDASDSVGNPLTGARVTLIGKVEPASSPTTARRYLTRHPTAAGYSGFADFSFFVLRVERAHFIGGFGRIAPLAASDVLIDGTGSEWLVDAEPSILAALNSDAEADLAQLGARLSGGQAGAWQAVGVDAEGVDLILGEHACRFVLPGPVRTPDEIRAALRVAASATG